MTGTVRHNARLLAMEERSFDKALYSGDDGMWTIFEIIKRPIAQAPSEALANNLIARLEREVKP